MKNNTTTGLTILNFLLIIVLITFIALKLNPSKSKIVYVNNVKVFEGFNMTKELKKVGEKEFNNRKLHLDSLYSKLQSPEISSLDKKNLMQIFIQEKEELNQFNDYFGAEQSAKIWTRIRSYSSEFSKENNYQIIIGSDDKGNVLFADESIDITNDLLTYINKKYEGLK
ncbi:outer membrane protein [Flavobacterium sp. 2755]|uniref:OmpH family outer membrane protein n=1 Tax=Flavobacterium sp. 2755 TaxID=2817765 RepID=UPI0028588A86|nr:OmpH family outer membrane protein [Flavobacterium sp. 2755]MDR6763827.1 outer membrane protein [Flavobacterium sp. 2755]